MKRTAKPAANLPPPTSSGQAPITAAARAAKGKGATPAPAAKKASGGTTSPRVRKPKTTGASATTVIKVTSTAAAGGAKKKVRVRRKVAASDSSSTAADQTATGTPAADATTNQPVAETKVSGWQKFKNWVKGLFVSKTPTTTPATQVATGAASANNPAATAKPANPATTEAPAADQTPTPKKRKKSGWLLPMFLIWLIIMALGLGGWKYIKENFSLPWGTTAVTSTSPTGIIAPLIPDAETNTTAVAATNTTPAPTTSPSLETGVTPSTTNNLPSVPAGGFVNVANKIKIETEVKGGIKGDGNMIGNGQVNVNSTTHNYYGLGNKTPSKGGSFGIQIPEQLNIPKGFDGWRWTTNLCAGQKLGYQVSKGWRLRATSDAKVGELITEILGHDGNWHTIIPGSTNTVGGTEYRFTVVPNATQAVEIKFHLRPK